MGTVNRHTDTQTNFTMRSLILSCLVVLALAQTQPSWFSHLSQFINGIDGTIDVVHGYRVEYHHDGRQHLLIVIRDEGRQRPHGNHTGHFHFTGFFFHGRECHFIEISPVWEDLLKDQAKVAEISEEIVHLIHNPTTQETRLTMDQIMAAYGDHEVATECAGHSIRVLSYSPSAAIMSS